MITPTERILTVVNFFSGVGGCALGMKWAGFVSLGSFDLDAKALRGLAGLAGGPTFLCDLAGMTKAEMRRRVAMCPDVVIMSPPCKKFSDLLPAAQAAAAEYVEMAQLALAGVVLACETWDTLPAVLILENVRGIAGPRGAEILGQIVSLLHRYGYTIDKSTHDCGEIGGLGTMIAECLRSSRVATFLRSSDVWVDRAMSSPTQGESKDMTEKTESPGATLEAIAQEVQ